MLKLEKHITLTEAVCKASNLAPRFGEVDLRAIGEWCFQGYTADEQSRANWYRRNEYAMDLAMQVVEEKSFPWPGASNVKFPLVTIAALQFHSRAYPAIVHGPDLVKYRVVGGDPTGEEYLRAQRISKHMSNQLLEVDQAWEEGMDRALINLPIMGCVFKKCYYDTHKGHNVSELVLAKDLVVDYYAKSIEDAMRKTHLLPLHRNQVIERMMSGAWLDLTEEAWFNQPSQYLPRPLQHQEDNRHGMTRPQPDDTTPFMFGEQHCWMDLDGDGYAEPYIVTFEITSRRVVRIVARWERPEDVVKNTAGRILRIRATEYFTKYTFIPAPDGGIYDLGFGILLGPLNASVDSLINILIDSGTMAVTAGGFLGRGVKARGGKITFSPLEWQRLESSGDDLRKDIVPLPVREPSPVLLSLLTLLVDYSNRIPGTTDIMVGENVGQNTPAETARSMVQEGGRIYSAIFKRVWRGLKNECKKLYLLNARFLPLESQFGPTGIIRREDYLGDPDRIVPSADPNITSEQVRMQKALALKQAAYTVPGYNVELVERRWLEALGIEGIETLYPGPDKVKPLPNPKIQVEQMKLQQAQQEMKTDAMIKLAELSEQRRLNAGKIMELYAKAQKELAEAQGVGTGHQIAAFELALGALKHQDESLLQLMQILQKGMDNGGQPDSTGIPRMAGTPGNQSGAGMGQETGGNP